LNVPLSVAAIDGLLIMNHFSFNGKLQTLSTTTTVHHEQVLCFMFSHWLVYSWLQTRNRLSSQYEQISWSHEWSFE